MTRKPKLLDLFCGAGGCSEGYARAGFDVYGVDILPQPRYPFDFVQADALTYPLDGFDVIHASPPCQAYSVARHIHRSSGPDLLAAIRERLQLTECRYVIENVLGAPMRTDLLLCGGMFPGLRVRRHRLFEFGGLLNQIQQPEHYCLENGAQVTVAGHGGHIYNDMHTWRKAMGIYWMSRDELAEAIPPAYTEYIGWQLR